MKPAFRFHTLALCAAFVTAAHGGTGISVAPVVTAVQREGITGAGWALAWSEDGRQSVTLIYPNHPDDFGGSAGTGTATSRDGGRTWTRGEDHWPLPGMVDMWQHRSRDGRLLTIGLHWLPDPKKRGEQTAHDMPPDAWQIARSRDGRAWTSQPAGIVLRPEIGVIARPMACIVEDERGVMLMPAYAWSKTGTRSVLLRSEDAGAHWTLHSIITSGADIVRSGTPVTTPWLETSVARTSDGSLLAVVRTGSSETSALVMTRSSDGGKTWAAVGKVRAGSSGEIVSGKLPGLRLMANGTLVLLTAHSKSGCHLHLSADGTGREWSEAHTVTNSSGGNTSMVAVADDQLLVFTPANGRINCWRVTLGGGTTSK